MTMKTMVLEDTTEQRTVVPNNRTLWSISPGTIFGGLLETNDSNQIDDQPDTFKIFEGAPVGEESSLADLRRSKHPFQASLGETVADPAPNNSKKKILIGTDTELCGPCGPLQILAGCAGKPVKDIDKNIPGTHVETCGPMDILAGRVGKPKDDILGKAHSGTKIFNDYIEANFQSYRDQSRRVGRSLVIKNVVSQLLSRGCRFLKFDSKAGCFIVLDEKQIRDKVSFAFRHQGTKPHTTDRRRTKMRRMNKSNNEKQPVKWKTNQSCPTSLRSVKATSVTAGNSNSSLRKTSEEAVLSTKLSSLPPHHCFFLFKNTAEQPLIFSQSTLCEEDDEEREFIEKIKELDADSLSLDEEEHESAALETIGDESLGYTPNPFLQSFEEWLANMATPESAL